MVNAIDNKPFRIRPRFESECNKSVMEVYEILATKLQEKDAPFHGKVTHGFVTLFPKEQDHHYWSPHLSVIIEESENGSLLRGHYGPSPPVWTLFIFLYAIIGLSIVILTVIGFANRSIGLSGAVLWSVPILIIGILSLYYASYLGQKKGHDQIEKIHHFFEESLNHRINS